MRRAKRKKKVKKPSSLKGLTPGIRMKGGVLFDPEAGGFVAVVHTWDNVACHGEPEEWRSPKVFPTEEDAMQFYKTSIRPALERLMAEIASREGIRTRHRRLEE